MRSDRRQLTSTLPHIPVQLPPLTLPWIVQKNRKVPALLNTRRTESPCAIDRR